MSNFNSLQSLPSEPPILFLNSKNRKCANFGIPLLFFKVIVSDDVFLYNLTAILTDYYYYHYHCYHIGMIDELMENGRHGDLKRRAED